MKLDALFAANPKQMLMLEKIESSIHEKLGYLHAMIAKQGKDPEPVIKMIRSKLDPEYGTRERGKEAFSQWAKRAPQGDSKVGSAFGRKMQVTALDAPKMDGQASPGATPPAAPQPEPSLNYNKTLPLEDFGRKKVVTLFEAKMKDVLTEEMWSDIGQSLVAKLRELFASGDDPESPKVKAALDEFPGLSALYRYAKTAAINPAEDPRFWQLVDKVTGGKSADIRKIVDAIHEVWDRRDEKIIITEAKLSDVMSSLGLDTTTIDSILKTHGLKDDEHDLGAAFGGGKPSSQDIAKFVSTVVKSAAAIMKSANLATTPEQKQEVSKAVEQVASNPQVQSASDPSIIDVEKEYGVKPKPAPKPIQRPILKSQTPIPVRAPEESMVGYD
jgi:hypothetical protein